MVDDTQNACVLALKFGLLWIFQIGLLNNFYKTKFMDYQDPITSIHVNVEGMLTYNALIFIPKKPFYDFYSDRNKRAITWHKNQKENWYYEESRENSQTL